MPTKTAAEWEQTLLIALAAEQSVVAKSAVFIGAVFAAHDNKSKEGVEGFLNAGNKVFSEYKDKTLDHGNN
jgi:hypothetical protein